MKIELELNDKIVEGLLEAKKKSPVTASLEQTALTLLETALVAGGFLKMEEIIEQAFKSMVSGADLGDIEKLLEGAVGPKVGMVGIKIGKDGKAETIGTDDLPEGLRQFIGGAVDLLSAGKTLDPDKDDCDCPNCVARRASQTKKYS